MVTLITSAQAAELLGISKGNFYQLCYRFGKPKHAELVNRSLMYAPNAVIVWYKQIRDRPKSKFGRRREGLEKVTINLTAGTKEFFGVGYSTQIREILDRFMAEYSKKELKDIR